MTKEEFISRYIMRSGGSQDFMEKYRQVAVPCTCGEEGCAGWAMISADKALADATP